MTIRVRQPLLIYVLLRSRLNAKISLSFKRDFENDRSKLRILADSRLENQRIWRFVLNSTINERTFVDIAVTELCNGMYVQLSL